MATEVMLLSAIPNLGGEGDVVKVADGYARNYLMPQGLAAPVNEGTRRLLVKLQKDREEAGKALIQEKKAVAKKLAAASCTIPVKIAEGEKLYGSVTAVEIADVLKGLGIEVERSTIELEEPIKELGVYDVKINLHPEVSETIKVWVVEE